MHEHDLGPVFRRDRPDPARILVVESDPTLCELLYTALLARGFEVTVASDRRQALAVLAARGREISLMLSDFELPGDATEPLVEEVDRTQPGLPIAVIGTGFSADAARRLPEVRAWFDKPFSVAALLDTIASLTAPH